MPTGKLQIIPLGGMGEFGMNCMAIRFGDDIIVIDAGLMFPEAELLGVDIVVPDISYLLENRKFVRGIVLTHGHEDHIGALPWILGELNVPVWGTEFTLAYFEDKLDEHQLLDDADLREIRPGERFKVGPFTIHPLQVTHSLVDCVALAIHTPLGVVLHTGDFKVDPTPTDNRLFDLHGFAEYGKEGVLALLQDSTNVERKGYTPSERAVHRKFEEVFVRTQRRLFISCFSSSIHRIKLTVDMAREHGRKICFIGRSMNNSSEIAEDLGYIQIPDGMLIHPGEMKNYPPEKVCVLISGTQGEPMSALSRAAVDNHKHAKIEKGDTVVLSSRIIPGNEKAIFRMLDHMFRKRALVYYDNDGGTIHVSGHASQEEQKMLLNLVRPRYFIPVHGEFRQLFRHSALAHSVGSVSGEILLIEDGQPIEFTEDRAYRREPVTAGRVCVDSGSLEEIEEVVIRDRKHLSEDGVVVPIIAINKHTGQIESQPEIVTRGFMPSDNVPELINGAREVVLRTVEQSNDEEKTDWSVIKEKIRVDLRRYLKKQTSKRPLILPVILEL